MPREARRRFARCALGGLLALHLGAFALYLLNESQFAFLGHWRDGREAWRDGHLAEAALKLRVFAEGYRAATRPVLLRRDFPSEAQAWAALGNAELARRELPRAAAAFERAALLGQNSAWRERHAVLWTLGDAEALEAQGKRRLGSGNPEARQDLAAAAWLRGNGQAALLHYASALRELPAWLKQQHRPSMAADGGLVDEQLALYLLAGTAAWMLGDAVQGQHYCGLLAQAQDTEHPMDGLCRAAAALEAGRPTETLAVLAASSVAAGEQASFAAELQRRARRRAPAPQFVSPSPAPADRLPR